jgi:hypothetical protein
MNPYHNFTLKPWKVVWQTDLACAKEFFATEDEARAAINGTKAPFRPSPVLWPTDDKDRATQCLDHLRDFIGSVLTLAMEDQEHSLCYNLGEMDYGTVDVVEEIIDEIESVILPYFEDNDPISMGWVNGRTGRP